MSVNLDQLADLIADAVKAETEPLRRRIVALEAVAAEMQERGLRFRGTWQRADVYRRGDSVVHASSLWTCIRRETQDQPGASDAWQMSAKGQRG